MIHAEAHLGIDLQQQIRQLRFADPVIERGAQLDQLRLLFLGRQGCQMQLGIDPQFTGLDGLGDGGRRNWTVSFFQFPSC